MTSAAKKSAHPSTSVTYVDDVFSTYLYTGTGSAQTITNGIDLAGKGGMVWIKSRSNAYNHWVVDSSRGTGNDKPRLQTNTTAAQSLIDSTAFGATGFTVYGDNDYNRSGATYASWTFRKAAKFFDVVTYTGDGSNPRTIPHNLGSVPGCIIVKRTDIPYGWRVYHRGANGGTNPQNYYLQLETTSANTLEGTWNYTLPTSTEFSVSTGADVNASGGTYVAYLFAHDTSSTGLIQCGSFTTDASGAYSVNLGWEPQYILIKPSSASGNWVTLDSMRGLNVEPSGGANLYPNLSNAEGAGLNYCSPNATGFGETSSYTNLSASTTYIYISIRRPNKPPTSGTQVFSPLVSSASQGTALTTNFPVDMQISAFRTFDANRLVYDRLRGVSSNSTASGYRLITNDTSSEVLDTGTLNWGNVGFSMDPIHEFSSTVFFNFRRAPGFFDVVCYTGVGNNVAIPHNLGVAPEMIIVKNRGRAGYSFVVWTAFTGTSGAALNSTGTFGYANMSPTVSTNSITYGGIGYEFNFGASDNYVAYLFATLAGISKVGLYTGNGTSLNIDCGFSAGARFVLIKRTDSAGNWYVFDSARGISAGADPYLLLNSTAAEVTTDNCLSVYSAGFNLSAGGGLTTNISGATYIYLAIA